MNPLKWKNSNVGKLSIYLAGLLLLSTTAGFCDEVEDFNNLRKSTRSLAAYTVSARYNPLDGLRGWRNDATALFATKAYKYDDRMEICTEENDSSFVGQYYETGLEFELNTVDTQDYTGYDSDVRIGRDFDLSDSRIQITFQGFEYKLPGDTTNTRAHREAVRLGSMVDISARQPSVEEHVEDFIPMFNIDTWTFAFKTAERLHDRWTYQIPQRFEVDVDSCVTIPALAPTKKKGDPRLPIYSSITYVIDYQYHVFPNTPSMLRKGTLSLRKVDKWF